MELVLTREVDYLPKPNRVQTFLSGKPAPLDMTTTAFVVPVLRTGEIVFVHNKKRGVEIPGGHIEKGETAEIAAVREAFEETGYVVAGLRPIGFLQMAVLSDKPENYNYPYPISYQQFFMGIVVGKTDYTENEECLSPVVQYLCEYSSTNRERQNMLLLLKAAVEEFDAK